MKEEFKEYLIDSELNIKTTGRNDNYSDTHRYPYEPTSYYVLDRVIESGYISSNDVLFDYGCGYGRVPIYMNSRLGCKGVGIELVKEFYKGAVKNASKYKNGQEITFLHGKAEKTDLPDDVTACFFFNPFDIGIMRGVMKKILESYDRNMRRIRMFFYFPQDEYVAFLMSVPELDFVDEIDCSDLFQGDNLRNRVMVFEIAE